MSNNAKRVIAFSVFAGTLIIVSLVATEFYMNALAMVGGWQLGMWCKQAVDHFIDKK